MLIEFIGISGSGKSTIARSVTKALKAEGFLARHVGSGYEWVVIPTKNDRGDKWNFVP